MGRGIKKWSMRIFSFGLISFLTIVVSVFNPSLLYANKTELGNFIVYHNSDLSPDLDDRLSAVDDMLTESELYDPSFKIKICLNDGSSYPSLIEKLRGQAFGWGFHNIVTFGGTFDHKENTVELNGYKWNLEQLITHEIAHCLQANTLGMMNSNPIKNHPNWKWEGYPEYVSRKNTEQLSLAKNILRRNIAQEENPNAWGVFFDDGTVSPRTYYDSWLLVQFSIDVKGMTYVELLNSELSKNILEEEMNSWYQTQQN